MVSLEVICGNCRTPLKAVVDAPSTEVPCFRCALDTELAVFPALFRERAVGRAGEILLTETESSCFYHPAKKAAIACDGCGRFLCTLCDIEIGTQHLCPACMEAGQARSKNTRLHKETVYYDEIAFALAALPMVFIWPTLVTAPIAIYVVLRYRKKPLGILPRRRWRFAAAFLLAVLQIAGWLALLAFALTGMGA